MTPTDRHEELMSRIDDLQTSVDLNIELLHDLHAWLTAAFSALGVTVTQDSPPPRSTTVLRLVHGFKGRKNPDGGGDAA
jgi:hypothetical protein